MFKKASVPRLAFTGSTAVSMSDVRRPDLCTPRAAGFFPQPWDTSRKN